MNIQTELIDKLTNPTIKHIVNGMYKLYNGCPYIMQSEIITLITYIEEKVTTIKDDALTKDIVVMEKWTEKCSEYIRKEMSKELGE